jgi:hypothetical protein
MNTVREIETLQARALEILKIETNGGLTEDLSVELITIGDTLWSLGSRIPDNL